MMRCHVLAHLCIIFADVIPDFLMRSKEHE